MKLRLIAASLCLIPAATRITQSEQRTPCCNLPRRVANSGTSGTIGTRPSQDVGHHVLLPLSFEANGGQVDPEVKFLSRGRSYNLYLTSTEAVFSFRKPVRQRQIPNVVAPENGMTVLLESLHALANSEFRSWRLGHQFLEKSTGAGDRATPAGREWKSQHRVLRMRLVGANSSPEVEGLERSLAKSNYFVGNDRAKWRIDVPNYAKVRYRSVYPGVDLVYYSNRGRLEWDLVVAPGADPGVIKLDILGADNLQIDAQGDLVFDTGENELRLGKPFVYEEVDRNRREIPAEFVLQDGRLGFRLGVYDKLKPLIVDPGLMFYSHFGAEYANEGTGIAVDASGSAYVTGYTDGPDYPATTTALQPSVPGSYDRNCVVVKFNSAGEPVYNIYFGGTFADVALGIAVDSAGNAYVTGFTYSDDFPTVNAFQPHLAGGPGVPVHFGDPFVPHSDRREAFVAKLNTTGSKLVYSTYLGGNGSDYGNGISVDSAGGAYVTGTTFSPDFPTSHGVLQSMLRGSSL
jgi:Beta-propeller repeat